MGDWIDLTTPIRDHFRWPVERRLVGAFEAGDPFQITWVGWHVHSFTHLDAPRHMLPDGFTTTDVTLDRVTGRAAVVDLTAIGAQEEITVDVVRDAAPAIEPGDIVLMKTCWDMQASIETPEFWRSAPFMSREASEWLLSTGAKAVGFDFPQDFPIRGLLDGVQAEMSEMVTHDVLLRNGVILIEYLCNLGELKTRYVELIALPLKILDADGAPARVIARSPADS